MPCGVFLAPPHQQSWSPPPINRGRAPSGLFSYTARVTHYYLLLTTYYLNSYFLSFFSPFIKNPSRNASSDWDFYDGCNGTVYQYRLPTFGISNFIETGVDVVQRISLTFCAGYDDAHLCYLTFFRVLTPELDKL